MEMLGDEAIAASNGTFEVAVEADKLRAVKLYVTTSDAAVRKSESTSFEFIVTELNAEGEPESGKFPGVFHGSGE